MLILKGSILPLKIENREHWKYYWNIFVLFKEKANQA